MLKPAPVRICDTRATSAHNQCSGRTIGAGQTLTVPVIGLAASGVPVGATAVVVNLTGIAPTQPTFLTVFAAPTAPRRYLGPQSGGSRSASQPRGCHLEP